MVRGRGSGPEAAVVKEEFSAMKRVFSLVMITIGLLMFQPAGVPHFATPAHNGPVTEAGLPVYPGATPKPEPRQGDGELRTVSVENASVHELSAAKYLSSDPPAKVLSYYRSQLRGYGTVIECGGGENTSVSVHLSARSLSSPETCDPEEIGIHQVELKTGDAREQRIVAVGLYDGGSEFTLVYVRKR